MRPSDLLSLTGALDHPFQPRAAAGHGELAGVVRMVECEEIQELSSAAGAPERMRDGLRELVFRETRDRRQASLARPEEAIPQGSPVDRFARAGDRIETGPLELIALP